MGLLFLDPRQNNTFGIFPIFTERSKGKSVSVDGSKQSAKYNV